MRGIVWKLLVLYCQRVIDAYLTSINIASMDFQRVATICHVLHPHAISRLPRVTTTSVAFPSENYPKSPLLHP